MRTRALLALLLLALVLGAVPASARQGAPVVRGVLFFSPTCGHCEYVIQQVLPPLFDEHGGPWELVFDETLPETEIAHYLLTNGTLEFLLVDVTIEAGSRFFEAATDQFSIGSNGVPRLIVADQVMIGSSDIPDRLPGLIDGGLADGGIDWPDLPGIDDIIASLPAVGTVTTTTTATPTTAAPPTTSGSATTAATTTTITATAATLPVGSDDGPGFGDDPAGTVIAIVVLTVLLAGLGFAAALLRRAEVPYRTTGLVPLLVLAGIVIAAYLTYVEASGVEAVCGPVGDCNVVQESDYASVAGVPNGILGLGGYLAIGVLWLLTRRPPNRRADLARVGVAVVTVGAVAFSAWLTFAEAFLIHATCAWCIGSAIVILALMWLTVPAGIEAWRRIAPVSDVE